MPDHTPSLAKMLFPSKARNWSMLEKLKKQSAEAWKRRLTDKNEKNAYDIYKSHLDRWTQDGRDPYEAFKTRFGLTKTGITGQLNNMGKLETDIKNHVKIWKSENEDIAYNLQRRYGFTKRQAEQLTKEV